MATLANYLEINQIAKSDFDRIVDKDRDFFFRYIEWGETPETTNLHQKAIERLNEEFDMEEIQKKAEEKKAEEKKAEEKKAEEKKAEEKKMDEMMETMQEPIIPRPAEESPIQAFGEAVEEQEKEEPEKKKRKRKTAVSESAEEKAEVRKRKKNKFAVNKTYIAEHGKGDVGSIYSMRQFLLNDGEHKPEDVAMMSDTDIADYVAKEYYIIAGDQGTYLFRREALLTILGDICVIEKQ